MNTMYSLENCSAPKSYIEYMNKATQKLPVALKNGLSFNVSYLVNKYSQTIISILFLSSNILIINLL